MTREIDEKKKQQQFLIRRERRQIDYGHQTDKMAWANWVSVNFCVWVRDRFTQFSVTKYFLCLVLRLLPPNELLSSWQEKNSIEFHIPFLH